VRFMVPVSGACVMGISLAAITKRRFRRHGVVVNTLVSISVVPLHRARLLLGWVTVYRHVNHLGV